MAQLALECPHCRAEKIGFAARYAVQLRPGQNGALLFLQCEGCGQGVIGVMASTAQGVNHWINGQANNPGPMVSVYPKIDALNAPADIPGPVLAAYLSGLDNLGRKGGANAAAIMFRRSIEVAVKVVDPEAPRGTDLKGRINRLPADIATPAMKEWAHHIRLDANDAAHEVDEYTEDDAKKLHTFAEMFLTYAFTLPKMLERAKDEK